MTITPEQLKKASWMPTMFKPLIMIRRILGVPADDPPSQRLKFCREQINTLSTPPQRHLTVLPSPACVG